MSEVASPIVVRELPQDEGYLRLERMRQHLTGLRGPGQAVTTDGEADRRAREAREADVTEAARRSQAEIRRHVDAYLTEHFEGIAGDVASLVIERVNERIVRGVAAMQEEAQLAHARMASDVRAQLRAFAREAWGPPKKVKKRAKR